MLSITNPTLFTKKTYDSLKTLVPYTVGLKRNNTNDSRDDLLTNDTGSTITSGSNTNNNVMCRALICPIEKRRKKAQLKREDEINSTIFKQKIITKADLINYNIKKYNLEYRDTHSSNNSSSTTL